MLRPLQGMFDPADTPDLIVGLDDPDDAAVWRIDKDRAIVVTTDFFTPVVDDGYDYGAIAAANSLSDVYAMGGKPFLALNIAGMPAKLPTEIITDIFRGGGEKVREAGVVIAGGHTVQDDEPKYGLVVVGFVDPERGITKGGAQVGDALVLTKPLGFGATTTALKQGKTTPEEVDEVVGWMKQLNKTAAEIAVFAGVRGGTDVTGYSLLGHGWEMADASGVGLRVRFEDVPLVSCARKYGKQFTFPGGASDNRLHFGEHVTFASDIEEFEQMLLFDPQTSGGLLLALPQENLTAFLAEAEQAKQPVWVIGDVVAGEGIEVVRG